MTTRILAVLGAALLLVSCGGGGGGSTGAAPPNGPGPVAPVPTVSGLLGADPARSMTAAERAATSLPRFGSVTQSSNRNAAGVSTDAATASFDGHNLAFAVTRGDGSGLQLDSAAHAVADLTSDGSSPVPGYTGRDWYLLDYTPISASVAYAAVSWDNTDPTDYLAGGYWMHFEGHLPSLAIREVEVGAFVDGPELSGDRALPKLGTATYNGEAGGMYATLYGSDAAASGPPGSTEIGDFGANIVLTADFGEATISGCINCDGSARLSGVFTDGSTGQSRTFGNAPGSASIRLGPTTIGSSAGRPGSFSSEGIALTYPGLTVTRTEGSWGGQFSNIVDAADDPRLVAGTFGARARSSGGSETVFVGAYYAAK